MALDLRGFTTPLSDFEGLYKAADTLERKGYRDEQMRMREDAQKNANANTIARNLNPDDFFTGTDYDPMLIKQLDAAKQQAFQLASQGVSTPDIMMSIGPQVSQISQYSLKAKQIDANLKNAAAVLGQTKGYNVKAIYDGAKKMAFMNANGLKNINQVDPNQDYITEFVKQNPAAATDYSGFEAVRKEMPMIKDKSEVGYEEGGVHRKKSVEYSSHPWMHPEADGKGGFKLGVLGEDVKDAEGNTHRLMDRDMFRVMYGSHPALYDRLRGDIYGIYKTLGKEAPDENSPEWDLIARREGARMAQDYGGGVIHSTSDVTKRSFVGKQESGTPLWKPKEEKAAKKGRYDD